MPQEYVVRLTGRCNERCLFCFVLDEIEAGKPVTLDEVKREIDQAHAQGYERVDLFGGEPTTYPFLPDVMGYAAAIGMLVSLATNAMRFADEAYAREFFKMGKPRSVRVSLYSHDPSIHDRLTKVRGSHAKTLAGLSNIIQHSAGACRVSVTVVINAWNFANLAEIVHLVHERGGKIIKFSGLVPTDRLLAEEPELMIDLELIRPPLLEAIAAARRAGMFFCLERLPLCIAPEDIDHNVDRMSDARNGTDMSKPTECLACRYRFECPGLLHAPKARPTPKFIKAFPPASHAPAAGSRHGG